jgi:hypothetical protein
MLKLSYLFAPKKIIKKWKFDKRDGIRVPNCKFTGFWVTSPSFCIPNFFANGILESIISIVLDFLTIKKILKITLNVDAIVYESTCSYNFLIT